MKTRKLRLLSFILAVAMMFAIAPVSAFADATSTTITDLVISSGHVDTTKCGPIGNDGKYSGKGWVYDPSGKRLTVSPAYSLDLSGITLEDNVTNKGIIKGGIFTGSFANSGTIENGEFKDVDNNPGGTINGGLFHRVKNVSGNSDAVINGGIFLGDSGSRLYSKQVNGGIFEKEPVGVSCYKVTALGSTINGLMKDVAYVVGSNQSVTLSSDSSKFSYWESSDIEIDNPSARTLTFVPTKNTIVTVARVKTPLVVGDDGLPVDQDSAATDGWTYDATKNRLTVYAGYTINLDNHTVDWEVRNYGTIENGTFIGRFANEEDDDGNEGTVASGVFTPSANFGNQNPSRTWVNVKNGMLNDAIAGMSVVVGEQEVTVKPNFSKDLFRGWTYSGNISNAVAEQLEKQKNNYEMTLTLDGDAEDSINLMPMIDGEPFGITMLGGKATVDNADVSAAVPGQTVTLSIDDSEIPAGMSFDHWVVNPADVELEGGFDAASRTTSFTMPAEELTIYASLRTDSGDDGTDAMTVVAGVAVGAGVAALTYHIGTELYAEQVLGKGVAIPRTREEVALKAWELAGKPAVELNGEPLSEAAQAEKWAVESGLMQNVDGSFNGSKKMSKLKALRTLDAAKKLG